METGRTAIKISATLALGCALATAGVAALSLAPASDTDQPGFVQTAQAQTKAKKAKRAYKRLLSGSSYQWGSYLEEVAKASNYDFALGDINGDKVPELFIQNHAVSYSEGYSRVYTYYKGKTKLLTKLSVPPAKIYKKRHVLYYWDMHTGSMWGTFYKLKHGKLVKKASWQGIDEIEHELEHAHHTLHKHGSCYYTKCKIGSKSVGFKKYRSYVRKLLEVKKLPSETLKSKGWNYHKNTRANRAAYL
jgi:hypothetical protein